MPGVPSQNAEEVAEYCLTLAAGFSWGHCYQERVKWFHCNRFRGALGYLAGRLVPESYYATVCFTPWWGAELKAIHRASKVNLTRENQKRGGYSCLSLKRIQHMLMQTFTFCYNIRYLAY